MPVEPVDAYLRIATALAIVFHPDTRLEAQPLRQADGMCVLKQFGIHYVHQVGGYAAHRFAPVGGNHDFIQCDVVFFHREIKFPGGTGRYFDFFLQGAVADELRFDSQLSRWQIFQEIMAGIIGGRTDGCPFHIDVDILQGIPAFLIGDVAIDMGVASFRRYVFGINAHDGQHQPTVKANNKFIVHFK